jgi:two-component system phosphate regulon response regulator PhoB
MVKQKILIIEDDKNISKLLKYNLEKSGFETNIAYSGETALEILSRQQPNLIILDIMLPQMDGLEVCRILRQDSKLKHIPIVMLTAKGEEVDRIVGLELGADDYIVKPFSPREIILRIKAILRRLQFKETKHDILQAGLLTVDVPRHKVTVGQKEIELTALEFTLLVTLLERKGFVQSRETLLSDVWDLQADVYTRTVDTHIKHLREKIGNAGRLIETVIGVGYRFREENNED